jgi:hypothetical protein
MLLASSNHVMKPLFKFFSVMLLLFDSPITENKMTKVVDKKGDIHRIPL